MPSRYASGTAAPAWIAANEVPSAMAIVGARPATLSAATSAVPTLSFRSSWPASTAIDPPSLVGEQTLVLLRDGGREVKHAFGHMLGRVIAELERIPRFRLATLPTPLHEAPRLARAIGLDRLLLKRDDNTGLAFGGNKARKLEYLVADAIRLGSDILVTLGAPQSNHCRMTAAAARVAGMDCHLVLNGAPIDEVQGNMLLDRFFGATWTFAGKRPSVERMAEVGEELRASGRTPYVIPGGGSNGLGALGYVGCSFEMVEQLREMGERPRYVVCAGGSCGTLTGLTLGMALDRKSTRLNSSHVR